MTAVVLVLAGLTQLVALPLEWGRIEAGPVERAFGGLSAAVFTVPAFIAALAYVLAGLRCLRRARVLSLVLALMVGFTGLLVALLLALAGSVLDWLIVEATGGIGLEGEASVDAGPGTLLTGAAGFAVVLMTTVAVVRHATEVATIRYPRVRPILGLPRVVFAAGRGHLADSTREDDQVRVGGDR